VVRSGLVAVVPPARVPQALKERLGIIAHVTGDEVSVTKDGLPQELDDSALGHRRRQLLAGFGEILGQVKDHAGFCLGFKEGQVGQQLRQAVPASSFLQMSGSESQGIAFHIVSLMILKQ
jgi:hypothetical protein